jgi:hypothetical protein
MEAFCTADSIQRCGGTEYRCEQLYWKPNSGKHTRNVRQVAMRIARYMTVLSAGFGDLDARSIMPMMCWAMASEAVRPGDSIP